LRDRSLLIRGRSLLLRGGQCGGERVHLCVGILASLSLFLRLRQSQLEVGHLLPQLRRVRRRRGQATGTRVGLLRGSLRGDTRALLGFKRAFQRFKSFIARRQLRVRRLLLPREHLLPLLLHGAHRAALLRELRDARVVRRRA